MHAALEGLCMRVSGIPEMESIVNIVLNWSDMSPITRVSFYVTCFCV